MRFLWVLVFQWVSLHVGAQTMPKPDEIKKWKAQAARVTIIRDQWGIPHVYGKSDADAVFGLLYAQCEDDFARVEMNYITKLGRMAELQGEKELANDLYNRLIIDTADAMRDYQQAPQWLKALLQAYSDGIHYYLYTHPEVKPQLLTRFQPWYPLLWTDGSIGAISTGDIDATETAALYAKPLTLPAIETSEKQVNSTGSHEQLAVRYPTRYSDINLGSNGFAISPKNTAHGHALLYINPHTTFYFRPEVQMVSEEGLQAYGAVTWGQFFIYQGFNEKTGWMHTSSNVDVSDMYALETTLLKGHPAYLYDGTRKRIEVKPIVLRWKTATGLQSKTVQAWYTHLGPVMAQRKGSFIAVKSNNRDMNSLIQSWLRTKSTDFENFKEVMNLRANTSNNTVYADAQGNIAYWHGNFIPKRNPAYKWGEVVPGTSSATAWQGLHTLEEMVHVYNPASGWIQNCNSTPFTVSGMNSPVRNQFPAYMAPDGENFRGVNAVRLLSNAESLTIEKLIELGYDRKLSAFQWLVPALIKKFDQEKATRLPDSALTAAIDTLRNWNFFTSEASVATTLAIEWASRLNPVLRKVYVEAGDGELDQVAQVKLFADTASFQTLLDPFNKVLATLTERWGNWRIPWGTLNRIQRISGEIKPQFQDDRPSYAVPFASAIWGMLPSFNSQYFTGTRKRYGIAGNSFVCAVEFGPKIIAKSLLAGGNAGNPNDAHFADQLEAYSKGHFKDVYFYKEDVLKHATHSYHPGTEKLKK